MKRRQFIKIGAAGVTSTAALTLAAPAIAKDIKQWKMVTSWPKNLPGPGVNAQKIADMITNISDGRLEIKLYAAGEIVPGNGVFDAVSEGTAELYHSVPAYWGSKSKGILMFGSQPFGLRADEQLGWLKHAGGQELYEEMYARFGLKAFLCENTGPQWAGWFRNEINSLDDLKGLKFRTTGLASEMCSKIGMAVQAMSGRAMFQALQSGSLDAGEFIGPWTDSALGYYQVAKNYYWPGVGEPSSAAELAVNLKEWEALPDDLKHVVKLACDSVYISSLTEYQTNHAKALVKLVNEHGVKVHKLPDDVIEAMGEAAKEVIGELRESDDDLIRRIAESFVAYRDSIGSYMVHADNGEMNARNQVLGY
ncbi:MAG: TRAP transporter substrate-binding protein [Rhodospirillales bacterium]|jgi:TRAP-type mannitol/chloroaromatic compound transport system substrate-binding protein|nr:TRAP transporter substrate-binding protein [Rhodospirillales bacterium]